MGRPRTSVKDAEFGLALGRAIERSRVAGSLSAGALAASAGVSVDTIRSIESGRISSPGLLVTLRLCRALGTSIDQLVAEAIELAQPKQGRQKP